MKSEMINLVIKTLSQMGVTLTNIDPDRRTFFISLNKDHLIQSLEDTLKSAYGILWVMTYGKLNKDNKDLKINLNYKIEGEGVA